MRRRACTLVPLGLALAAFAAPAGAATLTFDRPCYLAKQPRLPNGQTINVRGEGFAPSQPVTFTLGSTSLGSLNADAAGGVSGRFQPPSLDGRTQFWATPTLTANDGANQAAGPVELRSMAADFVPSNGPPSMRVRFYVYGFGPLLATRGLPTAQRVYEHVLDPDGTLRATFAVGRTSGPCGDLVTARRRILPFRTVADGRWRFVFTTRRRYSARSQPAASVAFKIRTVFRR
jgi:hypothetical protein